MKRKFTFLTAAFMLLAFLAVPLGMRGQTTYEQLTSIASIDESAQYVLGIDGTGFHYSGTSGWGLTALPSAQTPIYYTLTKANDGNSFTAQATISGTTYYLQVPTSNTFSMATSAGTNTDLIIGTTQVSGTNYAVANKTTTTRHLRLNGTSGLRSYAGTTGTMAYFYKVVAPSGNTHTVTYHANGGTGNDIVETYNEGVDVTVAANTFSYSGHAFTKWNTNSGGTGTDYLPGAVIEDIDDDWDFYAQWEESNETTATLTATNLSLPTASYNDDETEVEVDGIKYAYNKLKNDNNNNIQAQATYGNIRNTTAYPGDITSVVITHTGTAKESTIYGSANGTDWTSVESGSGSITADFSGYGFRYFKITRGSNAAYWTKVEINYSTSGGSTQTTSDLAITGAPVALNFDLYNNSSAQTVSYTTSSTGAISITPETSTYFSYEHDATAKTITVTPLAVTPSAQTVTIEQAADDDYYAGQATFTISVVNSTLLANIAALTAQPTASNYNVSLSNALVTYVNGNYAYIQDESGAVVMYKSEHGLEAGDVLNGTANVAYQLHNANPQITNLTGVTPASGTAPNPTEVAQSDWNYTFNNVLSQYIKVTGATITSSNEKYYVTLGGESIQLYKPGSSSISSLDLTKTYSITGFPTLYNSTKELTIFDDPVVEGNDPVLAVSPYQTNLTSSAATSGTLAVTATNFSLDDVTDTVFAIFDSNWQNILIPGEDPDYPDWLTLEYNYANGQGTINYSVTANESTESRTAYFKLHLTITSGDIYSDQITITQAGYVVDYATLPFEWEGGSSADFKALTGVTAVVDGTDYAAGNSPYLIKFSNTDQYIQVKTDSQPGVVSIDVKMIGGGNTSTITIQGSSDGETFRNIDTLTISGAQNDELTLETTRAFAATDRYVKMVFTKGSNVGVGPITIAKYVAPVPSITVDPESVSVTAAGGNGTITATYNNITTVVADVWFCNAAGTADSIYDWINPEINASNNVDYVVDANEGPARTAYFKVYAMDDETNLVYSNLVTVSQAASAIPVAGVNYTLATTVESGETYIIVGYKGSSSTYYAMGGQNTNNRYAEVITISGDTVTVTDDVHEFEIAEISGKTGFYSIADNTDGSGYLYAAANNANQLKTESELDEDHNGEWAITIDNEGVASIVATESSNRNVMQFNSGSTLFACYSSASQSNVYLYKKEVKTSASSTLVVHGYSGEGGYRLIASPVTVDPANVNGMTSGNYDLYSFDQSKELEWRNYEAAPFYLVPGKGYLYAKEGDDDYSFTLSGVAYDGDGHITLTKTSNAMWSGWNLIGNPFNSNASIGSRGYYCMNSYGTEIEPRTGNISAMEGIFVLAEYDGEEVIFTEAEGSNNNNSNINLNLSQAVSTRSGNSNVIDRAIVCFGEGSTLPKFQLFEGNTKLYIPENGKDYAIVRSDAQGEMPVNFKAAENGTYTISVEAENLDVEYLHLIDNMTGANVDLLATPSYTFEARKSDYASRFRLLFNANTGNNEVDDDFAFVSDGNIVISNEGEATLQVIDMLGRVVSTQSVNGNASIENVGVAGVYVLRLVNGNNVKTQRIVVR